MHFLLAPYALLNATYLVQFLRREQRIARTGMNLTVLLSYTAFVLVTGFRDPRGDSGRYAIQFLNAKDLGFADAIEANRSIVYGSLSWLVGQVTDDYAWLFMAVSTVVAASLFWAARRLTGPSHAPTVAMAYLMFPFFVAYAVSGLRQGVSLALLLLGQVWAFEGRPWRALTAILLALLAHTGSIVAAPLVIAHVFLARQRLVSQSTVARAYFTLLGACVLLSVTGINESVAGSVRSLFEIELDRRYEIYLSPESRNIAYTAGFRYDFFLFSILPIASFFYLAPKMQDDAGAMKARWWTHLYVLLNCLYHLLSFIPFTDRVAAFSWFLIPLVIFLQVRAVRSDAVELRFGGAALVANVLMLQFYTGKWLEEPSWLPEIMR